MVKWQQWEQKGAATPGPRSSHCLADVDSLVYLFGGELEPRTPLPADTFSYDLTTHEWTRLDVVGDVPAPRVGAAMASIGSDVYLFGGRTGKDQGSDSLDDLWVLDTTASRWARVTAASGTPPAPRSYHAMAAAGGGLYVFGGCGVGGRLADLHAYDPGANEWRALPAPPPSLAPRGGASLAPLRGGAALLVAGGFCGRELADAFVYDIAAASWRELLEEGAQMPRARSVFAAVPHAAAHDVAGVCCAHAGHVVAFGGEVDPSASGTHADAGGFTADLSCFDEAKASWHALPLAPDAPAPAPRGWFASAAIEGCLVLHGGLDTDNERLGDLWTLQLHGADAADSLDALARRPSLDRGIFG